ncbi:MAG: hypothetical protein PVJ40_06520, partial [Gammaproteobacteria bacterium]
GNGFQGSEASVSGGFDNINSVTGSGTAGDTLTGLNAAASWTLGSSNTYSSTNTLAFAGFGTLNGGSSADSFTVNTTHSASLNGNGGNDLFTLLAALTGAIDGGAGTDSIDWSGYASARSVALTAPGSGNGFQGSEASVSGGFDNINSVTGSGTAGDTLTGLNAAASWTLDSSNTYSSTNTLAFAGFGTLNGGSGADSFTVNTAHSASLNGNGGNDLFTLLAALTGAIDGGAGTDSIDWSGYASARTIKFSAAGATDGFAGTEASVSGGFDNVDLFTGSGLADTFNINASGTADLNGGAGSDLFAFGSGTVLNGAIDGGTGSDTLDWSTYGSGRTILLTALGSTDGFAGQDASIGSGFDNIEGITGSSGSGDSLSGLNAVSTWTLAASATYSSSRTLDFAGIESLNGGNAADRFNVNSASSENLNGGGGSDRFVFADGTATSGTVDGGTGTDTLDYSAWTTAVSVDLGSGSASATGGINNIEGMLGGSASDTLTGSNSANVWIVSGTNSGTLNGVAFADVENLAGNASSDSFTISGGTLSGGLSGGAGSDTLTGDDTVNDWQINGVNQGSIQGVTSFTGIETLVGGSAADTFAFLSGGTISGQVDGAGGVDTLDWSAYASARDVGLSGLGSSDGFSGTEPSITGGFDNIDALVAGTVPAGDTLTGPALDTNWQISAADGGQLSASGRSLAFSGFGNLRGRTGVDSFVLAGGSLSGTLAGGAGADSVTAANSANNWTITALDTGVVDGVAGGFSGIENLQGGSASDTFTVVSGSITGSVNGGGGSDTLIGANASNTWNLSGSDSGSVNGIAAFASIENLTGGTADDTFSFADGASVTGSVDGSAGTDTLDYSSYTSAVSVDFATGVATGTGGISNIEGMIGGSGSNSLAAGDGSNVWVISGADSGTLNGTSFSGIGSLLGGSGSDLFQVSGGTLSTGLAGGAGSDTLAGANTANSWLVSGTNSGTLTGVTAFSGIENLTGGSNGDQFHFAAGASVSGTVQGGAGTDSLDYSAWSTAVTVNLGAGTATATGSISGVESVTGGSGTDTLVGAGGSNAWVVSGANSGSLNGNPFSAIENLTGGTGDDSFQIAGGTLSGLITGGGGSDSLTGDNIANTWSITGSDSGTLTGIGGFAAIQNLVGGSGPDVFTLSGGTISGSIDGAGGNDTLVGDNLANTWHVTGANAGDATGVAAFAGIENLTGGSATDNFIIAGGTLGGSIVGGAGADVLQADDVVNSWTISSANAGSVTGTGGFSQIESLIGGSQSDSFVLSGGTLSGTIVGGAGTDSLQGDNVANSWVVNGADSGTLTGTGGFSAIENLVGGTGADSFVLSGTGTLSGTLNGGAGNDALTAANVANTWQVTGTNAGTVTGTGGFSNIENLIGGSNPDSFTIAGGTIAGQINGGGGADTLIGDNMANTWVITGADAGTLSGTGGFVSVENLTGGTAADTFAFNDGATLSGVIDGAAGTDTLDWSGYLTARSITLTGAGPVDGFAGTETSVSGGFTNIDAIAGSAVADQLVGNNLANTFNVTASDAGDINGVFTFSGVENLQGGSAGDIFNLQAGLSGVLSGGGGTDQVNFLTGFTAPGPVLTIDAETLANPSDVTVTAPSVVLSGVTAGGSVVHPLLTNASTLQLAGNGDVYLNNAGALDLAGVNLPTGSLHLGAGGNVTESGTLSVGSLFSVLAGSNDITLDTATNNFGSFAFVGGSVRLLEASSTQLAGGTATNLHITASGGITDSAALSVAGMTTLDGGGGDVLLDTPANDFNGVSVGNAGAVTLVDANAMSLSGLAASGATVLQAGNTLTLTGNVSAASLSASAAQVDMAGGVSVITTGGLSVNAPISLTGGSGTGVSLAAGGDAAVSLGAVTALNDADLSVNSTGDLALQSVNLNGGSLSLAVDSDNDDVGTPGASPRTLSASSLSAGDISLTFGSDGNDRLAVGTLTTNAGGANSIDLYNGANLAGDLVLDTSSTSGNVTVHGSLD